jgi:UDP-N-acetylglucosamine 2-epimerase
MPRGVRPAGGARDDPPPENTDDPGALRRVLDGLRRIDAEVILSLHPRTEAAVLRFGLAGLLDAFDIRRGLGHGDFLAIASTADLIVSDSGGVQEEVTVLKKPLLVWPTRPEPASLDPRITEKRTCTETETLSAPSAAAEHCWAAARSPRPASTA